ERREEAREREPADPPASSRPQVVTPGRPEAGAEAPGVPRPAPEETAGQALPQEEKAPGSSPPAEPRGGAEEATVPDAGRPEAPAPPPPASEVRAQYEEPEVPVPEPPQPEVSDPRVQAILENPNITLTEMARQDLISGIVDPRVLDVVEFAASEHAISISVFATGHPYGPTLDALGYAGYPNSHYFGRAVDIYAVDGAPVSSGNQAAYELAQAIHARFAPAELGSPWTFGEGSFSDAMHQDHIHVGWAYAASGSL
ncbi:MAG: hypothetical protein IN808_05045, partial [Rubrobacter sp.]|nr:hypothetical protein [Rubrobacter sp.]